MSQLEEAPTIGMGIDIGGSGMKAALVDLATGELCTDRHRIPTPRPATPAAMLEVVRQLRDDLAWEGPVGVAFPGVVRSGTICTAANLEPEWVGVDAASLMAQALGQPVSLLNDADAAGLAEIRFGAPELSRGTTIVCTLGTGIGTAVFTDGRLLPNTELGHLELNGVDAETKASARAKEESDLNWKEWSKELSAFLRELERLLWPDRFLLGGGISKKFDKFDRYLDIRTPAHAATLRNRAGIVGAALSLSAPR